MAGCLDEVGQATAAMAVGSSRSVTPRCIASAAELRSARIDPRDAFLLSFIDGRLSLQSIVDASGMREDQVIAILDRLSQSRIVAVH